MCNQCSGNTGWMHESSLRFFVWRRGSQLAHPPAFPGVFAAAACWTVVPRCSSCPPCPATCCFCQQSPLSSRQLIQLSRPFLDQTSPPGKLPIAPGHRRVPVLLGSQHLTWVPWRSPHPPAWCASCCPTSSAGRAEGSDALTHSVSPWPGHVVSSQWASAEWREPGAD